MPTREYDFSVIMVSIKRLKINSLAGIAINQIAEYDGTTTSCSQRLRKYDYNAKCLYFPIHVFHDDDDDDVGDDHDDHDDDIHMCVQ